MERRKFVEKLGLGSAGLAAAAAALIAGTRRSAASEGSGHQHEQVDGPLASATVSFGQWRLDEPLNRFPNVNPPPRNQHLQIPYMPTIRAGGSVNFIISGLHQVLVYAPDTTIESIDESLLEGAVPGGFPGFVNDPNNRIYRGVDPRPLPPDRVEVVSFIHPGTYLVVCGFLPHFLDNMHGYIKVIA